MILDCLSHSCSDQVDTMQTLTKSFSVSYLYGNLKDNLMTYAIIETGGKQIKVEPGRFYDIELLAVEPDEKVTIDAVLLVQHDGEVSIGQPLVSGATVEGTVMRHLRGRKVLVYKMKPKKKTRKKRGHRQEITRLMIDSITINGTVFTAPAEVAAEVVQEVAVEVVAAE
jgi:large subunit ribosomal protein L21